MRTMAYPCGCYYYGTQVLQWQRQIRQYLPLLDSEAHSTILSTTSKTVLKQTFTNPSSEEAIKECIYTFPLYDGVSVVGFTCKIGSRFLTGVVKEKVKAKEIFDEAVAKGETAGILEQASESADVFSTKLGNIPAGKSVIVEITFIGELKHHETEGIRFTIPTSIAPRFGQGPTHAMAGGSQFQQKGVIKITVDVNMPEGSFIKGVQSPSHPIAVSMGALSTAADADPSMNKASATLSLGSVALEKDFVLIVHSKDVGSPRAILETHPTIPHHRALMVTLVPKFSLPPSRQEMVFVADRSGSMRGNIPMLISAMKVFLKSMPVGVKFNICSFGNQATFLWPQSKSYTSEALQEATSHVETFNANMGGTETFNAIKSTIEKRFSDLPLEIMLLTDGDIWGQEELFTYINQQVKGTNGNIRLFPLGIGNGVSSALIEGLARAGNGFSQSVQHGERLDISVVRMLRGALSPHITDYTLEIKYEKDDDDFELVDRVTEGLKVLLSDTDTSRPMPQEPKPTISLFDANVDPEKEDIKMQDVDYLPKVPRPKLLQAPHKIPSLFAFSRTSVYLLMSPETVQRNPTAVVLRATSEHGPLVLEIPIEALSAPAETIHQLAAKKSVQDLEEGRGWIFDAKDQAGVLVKYRYPSRFKDLIQQEAIRIGEKFQVAGRWCSFVAVEGNDAEISAKLGEKGEAVEEEYAVATASPSFSLVTPQFSRTCPASMSSPQSLQNYQMGLMNLEQQNKKRHQMARQPQAVAAHGPQDFDVSNGYQAQAFGASPVFGPMASYSQPQQQQQNPFQVRGSMQSQHQAFSVATTTSPSGTSGLFGGASTSNASPQSRSAGGVFGATSPTSNSQQPNMGGVPASRFGSISPNSNLPAPQARRQGSGAFAIGNSRLPARSQGTPQGPSGRHLKPGRKRDNKATKGIGRSNSGAAVTMPLTADPNTSYSFDEIYKATSTSAPENWAKKSISEKVHALISLQDFEGSWSATDAKIPRIMGFEIPKAPEGVDDKTWVTLLVTAYLEVNCVAEEGIWGLVAEKAKDWQTASKSWLNATTGFEHAWKLAREFVKE